jgi:2-methylcitrate dehydratase PrpD
MKDQISQELARLAVETRYEDLPQVIVDNLKLLFLDTIGCALAGITTDPGKMVLALAKRLGGPPESSIIGVEGKVACTNAAFANGQLTNTIDYDPLVIPGIHSPPYIIPSILAMAEVAEATGKDLILASVIGFEVGGRICGALPEGFSFGEGEKPEFRWSPRWGHAGCNIGVAAGAGKIMGLEQHKLLHAMGIAAHLCQVPTWIRYTFADNRSMAKYGVPGWQNTGGLTAVLLAEMGYLGDTSVLDDKEGFWKLAGYDRWHPDNILKDIGKTWVISDGIVVKPYPCCRMFQTELDCFLKIIEDNGLKPEDIESVRIFGHPTLDVPCFTNPELVSIADVQFSPAYIFAMAASGVPRGVEWQDLEKVRSPEIQDFAKKVSFQGNPEFVKNQTSIVEVTARGREFKEQKLFNELYKLTTEELIGKYRHNASRILTQEKIERSIDYVMELEKLRNIKELMHQLQGASN